MSVSDWFSDDELISEIRCFFEEGDLDNIDFTAVLGQIQEVDSEKRQVMVKDKVFVFNIVSCDVEEVE